jgi:CheY-like chemotaxis protein
MHSPATVPQFGLHLLVADDEAVNRRIMQRLLAKLGCTCVCVSEGDEAIAALVASGQAWAAEGRGGGAETSSPTAARASIPFDAFLSDIIMARTDGVETCAQLRAMGCTIPIYAVTGNASLVDRLQAHRRTASTHSPLTTQTSAAGTGSAAGGGLRMGGASGNTSSDPCAPRSSRASVTSAGASDAPSGDAANSGFHGAICKPFDQRALQTVLANVACGATTAMH